MANNPQPAPNAPNAPNQQPQTANTISLEALHELTAPERAGMRFRDRLLNTVSPYALGAAVVGGVVAAPLGVGVGVAAGAAGALGTAMGVTAAIGKNQEQENVLRRAIIRQGTENLPAAASDRVDKIIRSAAA